MEKTTDQRQCHVPWSLVAWHSFCATWVRAGLGPVKGASGDEEINTVTNSLARPLCHREAIAEAVVMCVCCGRGWLYSDTRRGQGGISVARSRLHRNGTERGVVTRWMGVLENEREQLISD